MNVRSNLDVDGAFDVDGNANVDGALTVGGTLTVNGELTVGNSMNVQGEKLDVDGNLVVNGDATIDDNLTVGGTLTVDDQLTVNGEFNINGDLTVGGSLNVNTINVGPWCVITSDDGLTLTYANKQFFSYSHSKNRLDLKTDVFNYDVNLLERLLALEAKVAALEQQQQISQERVTTDRLRLNTLTGETTYPIEITNESNKLYGTTYDYEGNELAKGQIWDGRPDWAPPSGEIGG
jgi:predicted acyltransferase (DUF342 family)